MPAESTSRPPSPAAMRTVDEICDQFERAWQAGEPSLEEFLATGPAELRPQLLAELAAIERHYRRDAAGQIASLDCLIAAHPALADELQRCAAAIGGVSIEDVATQRPARSDVQLASLREPQGLHIRCPHCASPVELLADTPDEDVTCRACGSTFCLVDREGAEPASAPLRSIGRFELIARLGVGGFGTVWKARDPELDRIVALKIPRRGQLRADEIDFFFREARAAAQLRHPHIVAVYEIGREDDTVFIVSDFVRGVTLSDWMKTRRPSVREAAELCALIADALDHAHERGVVHRDLKPSNVMIDEHDQPRIMDFGLAKRESGEITMTCDGQILGTAAYMAPEQAEGRGHWIDRRADVYSLGVVLFQLATGELPYRGNFEVQLTSKLLDDAPDPRKLNRFIPRDYATICLKCLEREVTRRYRDAAAVAAELRRFLRGEPIQARPLSWPSRLWRWTKRKPALAAAAALAALVAVGGPVAALVIDGQRRQLDGRVRELDSLVIQQQDATRTLRGKNAALRRELDEQNAMDPGVSGNVLEWRRNLIADVVERHFDAAAAALDGGSLNVDERARIQLGLGMMLAAIDRTADATTQLAGARTSLEELARARPSDERIRAALADCCEQLAALYSVVGKADAAERAALDAIQLRERLAEAEGGDATLQIDTLASHYLSPRLSAALAAIPALSQRVIDDWPRDAVAMYEAACRLTLRPALLGEGSPERQD
jgi:tRNA A-37 threonylcarbamoyl transferase component Bud32